MPGSEGAGPHPIGGPRSVAPAVQAHPSEIGAQLGLHRGPNLGGERRAGGGEDRGHFGRRKHRDRAEVEATSARDRPRRVGRQPRSRERDPSPDRDAKKSRNKHLAHPLHSSVERVNIMGDRDARKISHLKKIYVSSRRLSPDIQHDMQMHRDMDLL